MLSFRHFGPGLEASSVSCPPSSLPSSSFGLQLAERGPPIPTVLRREPAPEMRPCARRSSTARVCGNKQRRRWSNRGRTRFNNKQHCALNLPGLGAVLEEYALLLLCSICQTPRPVQRDATCTRWMNIHISCAYVRVWTILRNGHTAAAK